MLFTIGRYLIMLQIYTLQSMGVKNGIKGRRATMNKMHSLIFYFKFHLSALIDKISNPLPITSCNEADKKYTDTMDGSDVFMGIYLSLPSLFSRRFF